LRHDAPSEHLPMQLGNREARQRHVQAAGQFAGQPLNVDDDAGGKAELSPRTFRTFLRELSSRRPTPRIVPEELRNVSDLRFPQIRN
jgi:hypothetical protein